MIYKRDPAEWLAQVEEAPESAPSVVRILTARLLTLDEENERLRNTNIELRQKIDTKAHQIEITELKRQLKTFARLVEGDNQAVAVIVWSKQGDILALPVRSQAGGIELPPTWQAESNWRITVCSVQDDMLVVTKSGGSTIFQVADLMRVSQQSKDWHQIPGLRLSRDEFIAFMTPIGRLPLYEGMIATTVKGYGRKISRWTLDQSLQSTQFGKGIKEELDWQAFGELHREKVNVVLISQMGAALRFPVDGLQPGPTPAMRMERGDSIAAMAIQDRIDDQIIVVDYQGRALRRGLETLPLGLGGQRGKSIATTEQVTGAVTVREGDQAALLIGGGTAFEVRYVNVSEIPLADRAKAPSTFSDAPIIAVARVPNHE